MLIGSQIYITIVQIYRRPESGVFSRSGILHAGRPPRLGTGAQAEISHGLRGWASGCQEFQEEIKLSRRSAAKSALEIAPAAAASSAVRR